MTIILQYTPAELESVLQRHPDVLESCVIGKSCALGKLPTAFVIKRPGSNLTENELDKFVSGELFSN